MTFAQGNFKGKSTRLNAVSKPPMPQLDEDAYLHHLQSITDVKISKASTSLLLSWNPVTTDSAGNAKAISYYEVFRDTIPYFTPSLSNRIDTTKNTSYIDDTIGIVGDPTVNYFYAITACDINGNVSQPSIQVCEYDFTLEQGWSIFSFPIIASTTDLSQLLKDQLTWGDTQEESDLIFYFNPATQNFVVAWFNKAKGEWEGDLNQLLPHRGYIAFIHPEHARPVITILGTLAYDVQNLQIFEGWNLIGHPFADTVPLDSSRLVANGFEGGLKPWESDRIYAYSDRTYQSAWYQSNNPEWLGALSELEIGKGYWLLRIPGRGAFWWQCSRPRIN